MGGKTATKKKATYLRKEAKRIVKKKIRKATARSSLKKPVTRKSKPTARRVTFESEEKYLSTDFDTSEEEIESRSIQTPRISPEF